MLPNRIGNLSLLSLAGGLFIQIGAQLFALLVIVKTLVKAPPESLAMLNGPYGYDSSRYCATVAVRHL